MIAPNRLAIRGVALAALALGTISSYNLFVPASERIGWSWLGTRVLFVFGPLLFTVGALLLWNSRRSHDAPEADDSVKPRHADTADLAVPDATSNPSRTPRNGPPHRTPSPTLLWLGTLLLALPMVLFGFSVFRPNEILGFFFTMSLLVLGLPGRGSGCGILAAQETEQNPPCVDRD